MNTDDMIRALPYWKTKDGKLTMIKNMKTRELKNIIRWLKRKGEEVKPVLDEIQKELEARE